LNRTISADGPEITNNWREDRLFSQAGVCMDEIGAETIDSGPELKHTLWHCHRCAVLVAIYSAEIVEMAICPICCDVKLDHRGSFESILGIASRVGLPVVS
jgi:hypothetical protein